MISRSLVILLAFLAAGIRATQAAWVESIGLAGLGAGLVLLRTANGRAPHRTAAWLCFSLTAVAVIVVFLRDYR